MSDQLEWAGFLVALFAALGVLYLIVQTLYDAVPWLSYTFEDEGLNATSYVPTGGPEEAWQWNVIYDFTVWNRTPRLQQLKCSLSVPMLRRPDEQMLSSLLEERLTDRTTGQQLDRLGFTVSPGDGRKLAIQGNLRRRDWNATILEFDIRDGRLSRRHWAEKLDLAIPDFPGPLQPPGPVEALG
jgi:hypothetical protein